MWIPKVVIYCLPFHGHGPGQTLHCLALFYIQAGYEPALLPYAMNKLVCSTMKPYFTFAIGPHIWRIFCPNIYHRCVLEFFPFFEGNSFNAVVLSLLTVGFNNQFISWGFITYMLGPCWISWCNAIILSPTRNIFSSDSIYKFLWQPSTYYPAGMCSAFELQHSYIDDEINVIALENTCKLSLFITVPSYQISDVTNKFSFKYKRPFILFVCCSHCSACSSTVT